MAGKSEEEMSSVIDSLMQRRENLYVGVSVSVYDTSDKKMGKVVKEFGEMFNL